MKFKKGQLIVRPNIAHLNHFVYYYIMEDIIKDLLVGQRFDTYDYNNTQDDIEIFYLNRNEIFQVHFYGDPVY